jgi:hypothetical protein
VAALVVEGFDKYGGINSNTTGVVALLTAGEWTSASVATLVSGLSGTGFAVQLGSASSLQKTLSAAVGRMIGGFRINTNIVARAGIQLLDALNSQCAVGINTDGTISVRNGLLASGTALGTSAASISANTTHYIEFDITFGNAAPYQVWLDGVSVLSGSGDTTTTANNTANGFNLTAAISGVATFDDLYIFDATGSTNNAVLLTSPRVETQFPTSDGAVQFAAGAAVVGESILRSTTILNNTANTLRLHPVVPPVACTLVSIAFTAGNTGNGTVNIRPVVYGDTAGAPGTLLGSGSTVVGTTAGAVKTMPLTSSVLLSAGVTYWIGHMTDVVLTNGLAQMDPALTDRTATATFASGAPATAPAMAGAVGTGIWGNVTVAGNNWYMASRNPTLGNLSYVYDATIGHEDLYNFPALTVPSPTIHVVAVKGNVAKSDSGAKTFTVRTKSGATDSAGSASSLAPSTAYAWMPSLFPVDPATSAAWSLSGLNAAQAGIRVET